MSFIPKNLAYMTSKISQYTRNRYKIEATSSSSAGAGSVITVNLPSGGGIIDLASFKWVINKATAVNSGTSPSGNTYYAKLPNNIQSLISRVDVFCNGVAINQAFSEYNSGFQMLKLIRGTQDRDQSFDKCVQNSALSDDLASDTNKRFVMCDWLGLIGGETSTRFLDTSLVGTIQIRITLAGNEVLVPARDDAGVISFTTRGAGDTPNPDNGTVIGASLSYSVQDFYFTIDTVSLDPMYQMMLREQIARNGMLEVNFLAYYSFLKDGITASADTMNWSLSTQSLQKVYCAWRSKDYQLASHLATDLAPLGAIGRSYVPNFNTFQNFEDGSDWRGQLTLNSVSYPQYALTSPEACADCAYAIDRVGMNATGNLIGSFKAYKEALFVWPFRFDHPSGGCMSRGEDVGLMSGANTQGTNAAMSIRTSGHTSTERSAYVLCQAQGTLMIGAGQAVSVRN